MEELVKSFKFIEYLLFMHESCVYAFIFVSSNLWEKNWFFQLTMNSKAPYIVHHEGADFTPK